MDRQHQIIEPSSSQSTVSPFLVTNASTVPIFSPTPTSQPASELPLIACPKCGIEVEEKVSGSYRNPNRVYYKCPNYQQDNNNCQFWKWTEDYEIYIRKMGFRHNHNANTATNLESVSMRSLKHDIDELNKQNSELIQLLNTVIHQSQINNLESVSMRSLKHDTDELIKQNSELTQLLNTVIHQSEINNAQNLSIIGKLKKIIALLIVLMVITLFF